MDCLFHCVGTSCDKWDGLEKDLCVALWAEFLVGEDAQGLHRTPAGRDYGSILGTASSSAQLHSLSAALRGPGRERFEMYSGLSQLEVFDLMKWSERVCAVSYF